MIVRRVRPCRKPGIGSGPPNLWMVNRFLNVQFARNSDDRKISVNVRFWHELTFEKSW
jgi:hypothetical protein